MKLGEFEDEGTYQIDLIVTLFAILLVMLLVNASAFAPADATPSRFEMRPTAYDRDAFALRSYDPRYRTKALWLVRGGGVAEIDMAFLARRLAEVPSGLVFWDTIDGVDVKIGPDGNDTLDGFDLQLIFVDRRPMAPGRVFRWAVSDPSAEERDSIAAEAAGPVLVYGTFADYGLVLALESAFRRQRRPVEVFVLGEGDEVFNFGRGREDFGLDAVLRPY